MKKLTACTTVVIAMSLALSRVGYWQSADSQYKLGPDSETHADAPKGTVAKFRWESKIYEGVHREYYIYVPAQYDSKNRQH